MDRDLAAVSVTLAQQQQMNLLREGAVSAAPVEIVIAQVLVGLAQVWVDQVMEIRLSIH